MPAVARFSHIVKALSHRDFAIFTGGNLLNRTGFWGHRLAIGWLTWELTHSATWLGLMGLGELLPTLFLGIIAGALADRFNRLRLVRITQILLTVVAGTMFVLTWQGWMTVELLFVLSLVQGVVTSINQPARQALIPALMGFEDIQTAIAINSFVVNGARFIGPAIAGFVITKWGVAPAFAVATVSFCLLEGALWFIDIKDNERPPRKRLMTDAVDGLSYAAKHPGIGPVLLVLSVAGVLGRPILQMLPAFSADVFGHGADGLAWFTSTMGAGALIGGMYMVQRRGIGGLTRVFVSQTGLFGIGLIAFVAQDQFWVAVPIMAVIGWAQMVNGVSAQTLLQHSVDDHMRGRVSSLFGIVQRGGQALGAVIAGGAADLFGLRWSVGLSGVLCLICWIWVLRRARQIRETLET